MHIFHFFPAFQEYSLGRISLRPVAGCQVAVALPEGCVGMIGGDRRTVDLMASGKWSRHRLGTRGRHTQPEKSFINPLALSCPT